MRAYHVRLARKDQPTTKLVRYREARNIIDAISWALQDAYTNRPEHEWECVGAELVLRAPSVPADSERCEPSVAAEVEGVPA